MEFIDYTIYGNLESEGITETLSQRQEWCYNGNRQPMAAYAYFYGYGYQ
jgi:hypothetical protein